MSDVDTTEKKKAPEFWCKFESVRQALNFAAKKHINTGTEEENKKVENLLDSIEEEMSKVELFEIVGKRKIM